MIFSVWSCSKFEEDLSQVGILEIDQPLEEIVTDLPIINITVEEYEFDDMYNRFTEDIEIEGRFNLYRNHQQVINNEEIELEFKGNYSRQYSLKSLGVKFEEKFDNSNRTLINPTEILPHHNLDEIRAIRLRNSGNDFSKSMLKDLSYTQLAIQAGLDLDLTYGEASLVFINNKFYGLLNLRTEANTNGMAGLYDVKKSKVTLAKMETATLIKKDGDFERIDALVEAVNNKDIEYLKTEIDLNNFIDYMVFESFIANEDWPETNVRFHAINDSKFRFILFDLDVANDLLINKSPISFIDKPKENFMTDLFFVFYEDENFKKQFWNRYTFLMKRESLSSSKFESHVLFNFQSIKNVMPLQIEKHQSPKTMIEWYLEVEKLITHFNRREEVIKKIIGNDYYEG